MKILTLNVRYQNDRDGENSWEFRRENLVDMIAGVRPCIFGVQEALPAQVSFIKSALERRDMPFEVYGVGRNDGMEGGETTSIFFRTESFICLNRGTFWLSDRPDEPGSKFLSAAFPRTVTWMQFQCRHHCEKPFFVFNTHFDHRGQEARELSAHLILQKISQIAGLYPAILMGDFNDGEVSNTYKILTSSYLNDSRRFATHKINDHLKTFTDFYPASSVNPVGTNIDFVLVSGFFVPEFEVLDHRRPNGLAISDHRGLSVTCSINV